MGIYREISYTGEDGRPANIAYSQSREITIRVSEPGLEYSAVIKPEYWTEKRTDCFCCSCEDGYSSDPACRNHGFAGKRPCTVHNMPGSTWEDTDEMPESVQECVARSN